jgi:hypothetical protein
MQKVTYVLLQRRANKYWEIGQADDEIVPTTPAKRRRPITICAVGSNRNTLPGIASVFASDSRSNAHTNCNSTPSLCPLDPDIQLKQSVNKMDMLGSPTDGNDMDMDLPPPVPPKPIIIRADLIYNQIRQDIENSVCTTRKHSSCPPNDL